MRIHWCPDWWLVTSRHFIASVSSCKRMLYTAAMCCDRHPPTALFSFCLQEITPGTVTSVVRTLLHKGKPTCVLSGLFELPAARSLTSYEVCDLLLLAVRKGAHEYMSALAR